MNKVWNEVEIAFLKENAQRLTDNDGARKLSELVGRTITMESWRKKRQKLKIRKRPGRGVCELETTRTVVGFNGEIKYTPADWPDKQPNVNCYGEPAYVNPDLWPGGAEYLEQEEIKRLVERSKVSEVNPPSEKEAP